MENKYCYTVACGFSSNKIDYSDYLKSLISRINKVYVFYNIYIDIFLKNITSFIYVTICFAAITLATVSTWFL